MNIGTVTFRTEEPQDYPQVYNLNTKAFEGTSEANLVDRLRGSAAFIKGLSLVALLDDSVVGHILFSKINIISNPHKVQSLALAPLAILPKYQHKGIGSALVRYGIQQASQLGYDSIIVLGHKEFYPKFGFKPANNWNIRAPFSVPAASFMALELKKDALKNAGGVVEYPIEFDML